MAPNLARMTWFVIKALPNVSREMAWRYASSAETRAMRRDVQASQIRSWLKFDMTISNPSFSLPRRFETGTSTSSNSMYVDPLAATPELWSLRHVTPFALRGIIRAETPLRPGPPVRTAAVV